MTSKIAFFSIFILLAAISGIGFCGNQYDWYNDLYPGTNLMNTLQLNYVPGMMILVEHYNTSEQQEKTQYWKGLATELAKRAGREQWIKDIERNGI